MKQIDLPDAVRLILDTLHGAGYMAYAVGGCVRDSLLGREPHDWDICTSATPEQTKTCFGDFRTIDTGIQHGTVTVMVERAPYEVTTFRKDGHYSDSRHPDKVTFVSDLKEDLARRDFTINAMAYNEEEGLVDPFGGQDDLASQMLRCVGNPTERFDEDALRILRALRFAATYGLWVHPTTQDAIHQKKNELHRIAAERIQAEMTKLICAESALPILLDFKDVVATVIPEMWACIGFNQNNRWHVYDVYQHIVHAVDSYKGDDPVVKWALLLHDIGKPVCYSADERGGHFYGHPSASHRMAADILRRLRFDNKTADAVLDLVLNHDREIKPSPRTARRLLHALGEDRSFQLLQVKRADALAQAPCAQEHSLPLVKQMKRELKDVLTAEQCFSLRDLAVSGKDIVELGVPTGPMVGQVLKHLLTMVMDEYFQNEKEPLLQEARDYLGNH